MARTPDEDDTSRGNGNGVPSPVPEKPRQEEPENPLGLQDGRSYMFWDPKLWKGHAERMHRMAEEHEHDPPRAPSLSPSPSRSRSPGDEGHPTVAGAQNGQGHLAVRPNLRQVPSYVSRLSDEISLHSDGTGEEEEETDEDEDEGEFDDAVERQSPGAHRKGT